MHYLDSAQRAIQSGGASRKPTEASANAQWNLITESDVAARNHGSQRRHRERHRIATGKANVFEFCSGALPFVLKRKTRSLWLPAQMAAVIGSQPVPALKDQPFST